MTKQTIIIDLSQIDKDIAVHHEKIDFLQKLKEYAMSTNGHIEQGNEVPKEHTYTLKSGAFGMTNFILDQIKLTPMTTSEIIEKSMAIRGIKNKEDGRKGVDQALNRLQRTLKIQKNSNGKWVLTKKEQLAAAPST